MRQIARWISAMLLGGLLIGASSLSHAETLVATTTLSTSEQAMLEENPALAELAAVSPGQLREVLDRIDHALANPAATRGGLEQLDPETVRLFGQNPVLLQVWRSSPEASADLLELIRIAAGSGKPKK